MHVCCSGPIRSLQAYNHSWLAYTSAEASKSTIAETPLIEGMTELRLTCDNEGHARAHLIICDSFVIRYTLIVVIDLPGSKLAIEPRV